MMARWVVSCLSVVLGAQGVVTYLSRINIKLLAPKFPSSCLYFDSLQYCVLPKQVFNSHRASWFFCIALHSSIIFLEIPLHSLYPINQAPSTQPSG